MANTTSGKLSKSLSEAVNQIIPDEDFAGLVFGYVSSMNPLRIQIESNNGTRFEIGESNLYITKLGKRLAVTIKHNHTTGQVTTSKPTIVDDELIPHVHTVSGQTTSTSTQQIVLWEGLSLYKKVALIRVARGSMYILIDIL